MNTQNITILVVFASKIESTKVAIFLSKGAIIFMGFKQIGQSSRWLLSELLLARKAPNTTISDFANTVRRLIMSVSYGSTVFAI